MLTKTVKWVTMAVLLLTAALLWHAATNSQFPQFLLGFVVCFGAGVVVMQAARAASSAALRAQPVLSIPSITGRNPGSESL